jgi:hypothetical protein
MIGAIRIHYKGAVPGIARRELNRLKKEAWYYAGYWWFREVRPLHFSRDAFALYQYTPRMGERGTQYRKWKATYTARKLKKFGHTKPLVFTGTSERLAKQGRVTSTGQGVRVSMPAYALNFKTKGARMSMRHELAYRFTGGERRQAGVIVDRILGQKLNRLGINETKVI